MPIQLYALRRIQFLLQYKANFAFINQFWRGGRRNKPVVVRSTFFNGTRRQQATAMTATARALSPEALRGLGVENFSTPQARFREGYREIPHDSRKTSEISNAKLFKRYSTLFDDVQALGRRKCRLFTFSRI